LQLVQDLTQQLRGSMAITQDGGAAFIVSFDANVQQRLPSSTVGIDLPQTLSSR
jgi:hypothetical protein